jgi:hypothetical protein
MNIETVQRHGADYFVHVLRVVTPGGLVGRYQRGVSISCHKDECSMLL